MEFNQYEMPVFSPLDGIEEVLDGVLGDISFVSKPQRKVSAHLEFCYTPGRQHRCMTEFLLHHDVIGWADVTHRITATAHYPPSDFTQPLKTWRQRGKTSGTPTLRKEASTA